MNPLKMAISRRIREILSRPSLFNRLKTLISQHQRWNHTSSGTLMGINQIEGAVSTNPSSKAWKIVDSRTFGIKKESVLPSTLVVLKTLQTNGYVAYLVGGCVRDLILKRTPKDFDVITTASLKQIKKQFRRCIIIGRRFPICQVYISGNVIEVSSFNTIARNGDKQEEIILPQISNYDNNRDLTCWKDCMKRDFTINCLFFDPFKCKIYDFVDGIKDLRAFKVCTVIPPHLAFKDDCAKILRGVRIAARLALQFSKETETAIQDLSSSVLTLKKERLLLEMNFMMAHGAAASSINLLEKFKLLELLLPAHAAYLASQSNNLSTQKSMLMVIGVFILYVHCACINPADPGIMARFDGEIINGPRNDPRTQSIKLPTKKSTWCFFLGGFICVLFVKEDYRKGDVSEQQGEGDVLFFRWCNAEKLLMNADKLLRADRPCSYKLWLGLLAFHLALVDNPQDSLVIWTFSSILYHGTWNDAVAFVEGSSNDLIHFVPEILTPSKAKPDELLLKETLRFASLAMSSVGALTDSKVLQQSLAKYSPLLSSQCLVFVPPNTGKKVSKLFDAIDICINGHHEEEEYIHVEEEKDSYKKNKAEYLHSQKGREKGDINYELLKIGDLNETRFVLGKIIMDTMRGEPIFEADKGMAKRENNVVRLSSLFQ